MILHALKLAGTQTRTRAELRGADIPRDTGCRTCWSSEGLDGLSR